MTILIIAAHPSDEIMGCGGTIAKYANKKEKVVVLLCSDGKNSNPLLDPEMMISKQKKEAKKANKILGTSKLIFLELPDTLMALWLRKPEIKAKVKKIIKEYKPRKIFTHSLDDPHQDHIAVAQFIKSLIRSNGFKAEIYTFNIGSPFRIIHRREPQLYVDISKYVKLKKRAMKQFKTQRKWFFYYSLLYYYSAIVNLKNRVSGWDSGYKFAERFIKW